MNIPSFRSSHMLTSQALSNAESLLARMRAVAEAAQDPDASTPGRPLPAPGGFAAELARSLDRVSQVQDAADVQARAFELGSPDAVLSDVMIDLQKASLAFQATVQVRNRLVEAYKEVANMAI